MICRAHATCSLDLPPTVDALRRLHREARRDWLRFPSVLAAELLARATRRAGGAAGTARRFRDLRIALSPRTGRLLYLVARTAHARSIVEFGTSFGISTVYLAAAARDNGGGRVIGTEIEPGKQREAELNLAQAGLSAYAEVRLGDALETLADVPAPIDLVFLDGWTALYLPVLQLLTPSLRAGSVVLADCVQTFRYALGPYLRHVRREGGPFLSTTMPFEGGIEYSVFSPR